MCETLYRRKFDVRQCTASQIIIMTLDKGYPDNPMQYIRAVGKCFCTASSQDSLCHSVFFSPKQVFWSEKRVSSMWQLYCVRIHLCFFL